MPTAPKKGSATKKASRSGSSTKKRSRSKTAAKKGRKTTKKGARTRNGKAAGRKTSARRSTRSRKKSRSPAGSSGGVAVADVILERQFSHAPRSGGPGVLLLGVDMGTRRTALAASRAGRPLQLSRDTWATVVGSPKPGVAVAGGSRYLFGNHALNYSEHLELTWPVRDGVIDDMELCRKFVGHLRKRVNRSGNERIWAVTSVPADSTAQQRRKTRQVMLGAFERVFLVPEPYLAALGMLRDSSSHFEGISIETAVRSLVVDIGDRSTRICLLQGGFPVKDDQLRLERGGTFIDDQVLLTGHMHSNLRLTPDLVRSIKEEQGIVALDGHTVSAGGGPHTELLDLVVLLREACEQLLILTAEGIEELLERSGIESLTGVADVVLLTGRSSRIPGMNERLESLLQEKGLGRPRVLLPADHERLVARGALHVAEALSEEEWSTAEEEQRQQDRYPTRRSARQTATAPPEVELPEEEPILVPTVAVEEEDLQ